MIGRTLGQFLVLEQIGAGGMGVVYKARDESLDRDVVLKVLPPGALADETARKRFRAEALALSRLNHPNICTIYQVGEADGQTYIAMEYVQGRQLNELIRDGLVSMDAVARYGGQIAEALAHAHERGLTHRDMKSGNVMITPEGRAKVLDFGLAVPSASADSESTRTQLTETGAVVGTPAYMPPESGPRRAGRRPERPLGPRDHPLRDGGGLAALQGNGTRAHLRDLGAPAAAAGVGASCTAIHHPPMLWPSSQVRGTRPRVRCEPHWGPSRRSPKREARLSLPKIGVGGSRKWGWASLPSVSSSSWRTG